MKKEKFAKHITRFWEKVPVDYRPSVNEDIENFAEVNKDLSEDEFIEKFNKQIMPVMNQSIQIRILSAINIIVTIIIISIIIGAITGLIIGVSHSVQPTQTYHY